MSITIKGFAKGLEPYHRHYEKLSQAKMSLDGYYLDYANINCDLTTMEDFDDLIKFLQVHRNCFLAHRKEQPQRINLNK